MSMAAGTGSVAVVARLFSSLVRVAFLRVVMTPPAHDEDITEAKARLRCLPRPGWRGQRSNYHPDHLGPAAELTHQAADDYQSRVRNSPTMSPYAKWLGEQEDLPKGATYFATKSWPPQSMSATLIPAFTGIAQCQLCHQPNLLGVSLGPRLAGLSYRPLVAEIERFAHRRKNP